MKDKAAMLEAMQRELALQKQYLETPRIQTLYFGGGTPSVLTIHELGSLIDTIHCHYQITPDAEITLEANPDDLSAEYLDGLCQLGINRLSIGTQSFFDDDLHWMNRRHNTTDAIAAVKTAQNKGLSNINIDLIYGLPSMTPERWKTNLSYVWSLGVPHLSAYHLTIEERTVFGVWQKRKTGNYKIPETESIHQFNMLLDWAEDAGFEHYEISNFAKAGYHSRHNSGYWLHKPYMGIGPSAHSFDGHSRQWNICNNSQYIHSLTTGDQWFEREQLTTANQYNDYVMLALRTIWGVDCMYIGNEFGQPFKDLFCLNIKPYLQSQHIEESNNIYKLTRSGMLIADRIASDLFWVED